jgi:hypothetical protein
MGTNVGGEVLQTSKIKRSGIEEVFQKEGVYLIMTCFIIL